MSARRLFESNAYGDTWVEEELDLDTPTIEMSKSELFDRCFDPGKSEDIDRYLATVDIDSDFERFGH